MQAVKLARAVSSRQRENAVPVAKPTLGRSITRAMEYKGKQYSHIEDAVEAHTSARLISKSEQSRTGWQGACVCWANVWELMTMHAIQAAHKSDSNVL